MWRALNYECRKLIHSATGVMHFLLPNAFFNPELLTWESSVSMESSLKQCILWLKVWNILFMGSTGQNTHFCLFSVTSSIFIWKWETGMGMDVAHSCVLGGFRPYLGRAWPQCQCLRLSHSILRGSFILLTWHRHSSCPQHSSKLLQLTEKNSWSAPGTA